MKLADYVIEFLRDAGVKKVFLVYGSACGDLVDAFSRVKGIDYVAVMHEQAGAFAAETYAKVSGELCAAIATSGPGGINLLNGIANAYYDSAPCIFITGQVNSQFMKPRVDERWLTEPIGDVRQVGFQENDIVSMARPITKMAIRVARPRDIKDDLNMAVSRARGGRPGPVLIDIPMDIQKAEINPEGLWAAVNWPAPFYDAKLVQQQAREFVQEFLSAKRPVLLVGGGIRWAGAVEAVRRLGQELRVPCLPTWNAIDVFTSDYEFYRGRVGTYGGPGRNFAIQNCDLLLCIGTRLSGRITGGNVKSFARAAKKYIVDIDGALLRPELQQVKGDVNIHCDAKTFIGMLLTEIRQPEFRHQELQNRDQRSWWLEKTREWRDKYQPCLPVYHEECRYVHPYAFMKVLSQELGSEDVVVSDCGGNAVVTFQALETRYGQRVVSSHGNSPMGYAFAGAMGACFIPEKRVVCLIGDGGFNMNIQELQTVRNYGLSPKVFIMNNHCYGITRQYEETNFEGRYLACGPDGYSPPDFVPIVQAYGIKTETISAGGGHPEMRRKIRQVLDYPGPIVCDVDMGLFCQYQPRIFGWQTPIEDMYPYLSREEFRANMIIDPVLGWENPPQPGGMG